jgi:hypothetical protein
MRREKTLSTAHIASWDASAIGIDGHIVRTLPITSISIQYWLNRLSLCLQQVAMMRLTKTIALHLRAKNRSGSQGR